MATFDFISGSDFRESLKKDYKELIERNLSMKMRHLH
jgi:hypothetical protein